MKCYADSSFILQLLVEDFANEEAVHCFRRLGRPALSFSGLHTLEITNGLRLRLFAAAAMGSKAGVLCAGALQRITDKVIAVMQGHA